MAILALSSLASADDLFFHDDRQPATIEQNTFPLPPDNKPVPFPIPTVSDQPEEVEKPGCDCVDCDCQTKGLESAAPTFIDQRTADQIDNRFSQLDARLTAVESPGPGFVDQRLQSDMSQIERRLSALEGRVEDVDGRVMTLDGRVEKVEEQLKAILTLQKDDGTKTTAEVPIDQMTGYGEHVVPGSYRVTHINGVPVARSTMSTTTTANVRYVTPQFTAQPVAMRTIRIFPRLFGGTRSVGTCRIDPVTGMRVCN